jgi:methionine biosynthesis protein MetW
MPVSKTRPHAWFNSTNIHLCTIKDFEQLCTDKQVTIMKRSIVDHEHQDGLGIKLSPNLFGEIALYQIKKSTI